jgi:ATP-dependent DNA helicase DinG
VAAVHLGLQVSRGQVDWLLNKLWVERRGVASGLLTLHGDQHAFQQVYDTHAAAEQFFAQMRGWLARQPRWGRSRPPTSSGDSLRVRQRDIIPNLLSEPLSRLASHLDRIGEGIQREEERIEYEAASRRCLELAHTVEDWLQQKLAGQV